MSWRKYLDKPHVIQQVIDGVSIRQLAKDLNLSRYGAKRLKQHINGEATVLPEDDDTEESEPQVEVKGDRESGHIEVDARGQGLVMSLDDLIRVSGLDVKKWRVTRHAVKTWTVTVKGPDGLPRVVRNWGVTAHCEERLATAAELVPRVISPMKRKPRKVKTNTSSALLIGDPQIGFRRRSGGDLIPLHDRRALDLLLQVASDIQPEVIICMGDTLDLAEWSTKYPKPMELRDTTQASLNEAYWWFAAFRKTCPSSRIITLEGNHDDRIIRALTEKLPAAATLRAVNEETPAMDMSRLLNLGSLDVEYVGPYPEPLWLWDDIEITHGETVRAKSGATVTAEIREAHQSKVFGHIHRVEAAHKTIWGPNGPRTIFVASPGCTCRIAPGAVPGVKSRQNWQQGWGLLVKDEDGSSRVDIGTIRKGQTLFHGRKYEGTDPTALIEEDIGFKLAHDWLIRGE